MKPDEPLVVDEALETPAGTAEAEEPRSIFPFRRLLPIGQLVLCALLLWPARSAIGRELGFRFGADPVPVQFTFGGYRLLSSPFMPLTDEERNSMDTVWALNLPAILVDLPYAIFSADHEEWRPRGMNFEVWRSISWPLLCLPLWWIAGRGLEALLAARAMYQGAPVCATPRIGWIETSVASLIMLACGFIIVCFVIFERHPREHLMTLASGAW